MDDDRAGRLLSGPRGRRLLAALLDEPLFVSSGRGRHARWPDEVRRRVEDTDLASAALPDRLHAALAESVGRAMYRQPMDDEGQVLAETGRPSPRSATRSTSPSTATSPPPGGRCRSGTPAGQARTLLGGWDPGSTWWLIDAPPDLGRPTDWRRDGDDPGRWRKQR